MALPASPRPRGGSGHGEAVPRNGNGNGHSGLEAAEVTGPAFLRHLRQLLNRQVELATACGRLTGRLTAVFPDHVRLQADDREHHVRLDQLCWFARRD